jgi:hypothetical protein
LWRIEFLSLFQHISGKEHHFRVCYRDQPGENIRKVNIPFRVLKKSPF